MQDHRVVIELDASGKSRPLQREHFETLYRPAQKADGSFDLDRIPPETDRTLR